MIPFNYYTRPRFARVNLAGVAALFVALNTSLTFPRARFFGFSTSNPSKRSFNGVAFGVRWTPKFGFTGAASRASNRAAHGESLVNDGVLGDAVFPPSSRIGVANAKFPGVSHPDRVSVLAVVSARRPVARVRASAPALDPSSSPSSTARLRRALALDVATDHRLDVVVARRWYARRGVVDGVRSSSSRSNAACIASRPATSDTAPGMANADVGALERLAARVGTARARGWGRAWTRDDGATRDAGTGRDARRRREETQCGVTRR